MIADMLGSSCGSNQKTDNSVMSKPLEQWIQRIPELSDADIRKLQQALDKEKDRRRDRQVLRLFRKKCIHAGRISEDDEISDFSEESPGEFSDAIHHGIAKLIKTLQDAQTKRKCLTFQTWKACTLSRKFTVSLKRPASHIDIE